VEGINNCLKVMENFISSFPEREIGKRNEENNEKSKTFLLFKRKWESHNTRRVERGDK